MSGRSFRASFFVALFHTLCTARRPSTALACRLTLPHEVGGEDEGGFKAVYDPADENGTITVNLPKVRAVLPALLTACLIERISPQFGDRWCV